MADWTTLRWMLLAGTLLVAPMFAVWDGSTYGRLTRDGIETTGVVTGKRRNHHRRSTSYHMDYRFSDAGGRGWTGSQRIDRDHYARLGPASVLLSRTVARAPA